MLEAGCTMSDVESDKHENDQEERRPFFGSVRPKMDKNKGVRYSIVHPLTQANFVGIFTLSTIVSYTLVLHLCEQDRYIPPTSFYVWLFLRLFIFWGTLYMEAMPMLFDRIIEISDELLDWAIKIFGRDATGNESDTAESGTSETGEERRSVRATRSKDRWRAPSVEEHTDCFKYDKGVVIRVYLLVAASVFFSCLFAMYSGGPFQSAYAQIIVAYPLFATGFARRWWSLVSIYAMTAIIAGGFQFGKSFFGYLDYPAQSVGWYAIVTIILLCVSLFVALLEHFSERRRTRRRKVQKS